MSYKPTWKERVEDAKPYTGPVIAGAVVLALAGWLVWHVWGSQAASRPLAAPPKDAVARSAAIERVAKEVDALEGDYQHALEEGTKEAVAEGILKHAIEKQKELMRLELTSSPEQAEKLAKLEAARGSQIWRSATARSLMLEKEAQTARQTGQIREAMEKTREALRLQHEANTSMANAAQRDVPRESRLASEIEQAEAEPLYRTAGTALTLARSAMVQERWDDALKAFTAARKAQDEINRRFASTRYADVAALDKIDSEIESLNAAGLASTVNQREREGDLAVKDGRAKEAATAYAAAGAVLREINEKFPRSRFASETRVDELEVRRQTALSTVALAKAAETEREVSAALRRRETAALAERLNLAARMVEQAVADYPRSRALDPVLRRKLAYLALRANDLGALQEQVFSRLAPLPGSGYLQMLKTEVPQELYQRVMNTNPSRNQGRALPVDSVSWTDARDFCERVSWILGLAVRLPTLQEFSAAWATNDSAWSAVNSDGRSRETGKSQALSTGFYDLSGNLAEWLQPVVEAGETAPIVGGSYMDAPESLKTLKTLLQEKRERARHIGFRVVVERVVE